MNQLPHLYLRNNILGLWEGGVSFTAETFSQNIKFNNPHFLIAIMKQCALCRLLKLCVQASINQVLKYKALGAPIHGLGAQSHFRSSAVVDLDLVLVRHLIQYVRNFV